MFRPNFLWPGDEKLPVPLAQVDDEPIRCISLNAEWLTYLFGVVDELSNYQRYEQNTQEERDHIYRSYQLLLEKMVASEPCELPNVTYVIDRVVIEDRRTQNTAGGSSVAGSNQNFPFNTIVLDDTGQVTLNANQWLLPDGTWKLDCSHVLRSSVVTLARGEIPIAAGLRGENFTIAASEQTPIRHVQWLTLAAPTLVSYAYRVTTATATNGLGQPKNYAGEQEVYGRVICERFRQVAP